MNEEQEKYYDKVLPYVSLDEIESVTSWDRHTLEKRYLENLNSYREQLHDTTLNQD